MHMRSSFATCLLLAATGCREGVESPTSPEAAAPRVDVAAASPLSFRQLSAGDYHTCGVTTVFRAYCWGANWSGQLGIGSVWQPEFCWDTSSCSTLPIAVAAALSFKQVSAGSGHTCGITSDSRLYCWGAGNWGELGDGTWADRPAPVPVAGTLRFRQVSAGIAYTCAVTTDNRAYCWGDGSQGKLGNGTTTARPSPVAVAGGLDFKQVSANGNHTCGLTTGNRAYCWGMNVSGQLGDSSTAARRLKPVRVRTTRQFTQIDAGFDYTCAVTGGDRAFCWGVNDYGQLGDGTTTPRRWPRAVVGGLAFERVSAGFAHTCGEKTGNQAYCWGANWNGQLGAGTTTTRRLRPMAVAGGLNFAQVSSGDEHTCGMTPGALAYCWGAGDAGQLGQGTKEGNPTPTPVAGPL